MADNLQNRCRICLDVGLNHVPILGDPTIYLHIKSCLSLNVLSNDSLPKKICMSCVGQVRDFYNFQLNARCSQDWLESALNVKKKTAEPKLHVQPLPDSEYNSDSLLEFLNNTANIEEYLNNLGRDDIPSIVNILDRTTEATKLSNNPKYKQISPKKKESPTKTKCLNMDIDVLDSDIEIVQEILIKETEPKKPIQKNLSEKLVCFGCKKISENVQKLSQHLSVCDTALRTCIYCNTLFDSKAKMKQHALTHGVFAPLTCNCGKDFQTKEELLQHNKNCNIDHITSMGYMYRCKECGKTFSERFQLYKHAKQHIAKAENRVCDVCGHILKGENALNEHKKNEHGMPGNYLYRCKLCVLTGNDRKKMIEHIQKHLTLKEVQNHLCERCGTRFSNPASLRRHAEQHDDWSHVDNNNYVKEEKIQPMKLDKEVTMCDRCGEVLLLYKLKTHACT